MSILFNCLVSQSVKQNVNDNAQNIMKLHRKFSQQFVKRHPPQ